MRNNFFWILIVLLLASCARMGNPDGGWYDDTPPRVVKSTPVDGGINVNGQKVTIVFNEFIKIEDIQNKVVISPPQLEVPDIKAAGKRIIINLKDSLKPNTTYTIDFSDAISDNNEGNPMGNYTFSFSTGGQIDTLGISGYVLNAEDLEPVKGLLVGTYDVDSLALPTDTSRHIFHRSPMTRVSRTNGTGGFTIKGVSPGKFSVFALKDDDGDYVYGQKSELIAFSTDTVTPSATIDTRRDTVWRDSLHIDRILITPYTHFLPDNVTLLAFKLPQTDRYRIKTERTDPEKITTFFSYGHDSLPKLRGLDFDADTALIVEASEKNDTITYWLKDTALVNRDTLTIEMTYMMTDSTGVLVESIDTVTAIPKMSFEKRQKLLQKEIEKWEKEQEKKKKRDEPYDSIMPRDPLRMKIGGGGRISPVDRIYIEAPAPLSVCDTSAIHLYVKIDTLWYYEKYNFEQVGVRKYCLTAEWEPGAEYSLEADSAAFVSIYGNATKPIKEGIRISTEDDYGTLMINVSGQPDTSNVIIELLNGSDKVVRRDSVNKDGVAEFFYMKPGKYYMRAIVDMNHNGIWDTGDFDRGLQPEPVYYYHEELQVKQKWDLSRDWNLTSRPLYQQKPAAITKQKPDKQKQLRNRNAQRAADKGVVYVPKG